MIIEDQAFLQIVYLSQSFVFLCVSGSELDPDSIGSVDPDPYSESGSGFGGLKLPTKVGKKIKEFHVLKCQMFPFES
jgi:hypothetical protein